LRMPAWQSLKPAARVVYIELKRLYNGANNGFISASVRQLADTANCDKNTVGRALKELVEKGFIERVTPGGFSRKNRHATEWRLSEYECHLTNQPATKTFTRWQPKKIHGMKNRHDGMLRGTEAKEKAHPVRSTVC
ncbi:MAG: helix-turn-helix domain-containing protein, partial [Gammaproteobacteria bacterium]|nr:helix-turn-helix domain-containing protein [Gammaproteobacteria bacterium]